jgi:hypothetical protein
MKILSYAFLFLVEAVVLFFYDSPQRVLLIPGLL